MAEDTLIRHPRINHSALKTMKAQAISSCLAMLALIVNFTQEEAPGTASTYQDRHQ